MANGDVPFEKIKQVARMALGKFPMPNGSRHLQIQPEAMAKAWAAIQAIFFLTNSKSAMGCSNCTRFLACVMMAGSNRPSTLSE